MNQPDLGNVKGVMRHVVLLCLGLASGCATTNIPVIKTAPEGDFGPVRTLAVDSSTATAQVIDHAVVSGVFRRSVPVPITVHPYVEERVRARLQKLGFQLCAPAPCGDGIMHITLEESQVNQHWGPDGASATARVVAHLQVVTNAGANPYGFRFTRTETGPVNDGQRLVALVAEEVADGLEQTLTPTNQRLWYTVDDGGVLGLGVNMLAANDFDGAARYFQSVVARTPNLAGAWFDLGVAWEAKNNWIEAAKAYEQAALLKRDHRYMRAARISRQNVQN